MNAEAADKRCAVVIRWFMNVGGVVYLVAQGLEGAYIVLLKFAEKVAGGCHNEYVFFHTVVSSFPARRL